LKIQFPTLFVRQSKSAGGQPQMEKVVTLQEGYMGMFVEAITLTEHYIIKIMEAVRFDESHFEDSGVGEVDSLHPLVKCEPLKKFLHSVQRALQHVEDHPVRTMIMELNTIVRRLDVHLFLGFFKCSASPGKLTFDIANKSLGMLQNFFENNMAAACVLKGAFVVVNTKAQPCQKDGLNSLLVDSMRYPSLQFFLKQFRSAHVHPFLNREDKESLLKRFQTFLKLTGNGDEIVTTCCPSPPRVDQEPEHCWKPSPNTQARLDESRRLQAQGVIESF